ncbi:MAG: KH domain-containing protein [Methanosarcinales archaeon]
MIDNKIRVPENIIGLIIGKKRKNIKMLEKFLGTKIKLIKV